MYSIYLLLFICSFFDFHTFEMYEYNSMTFCCTDNRLRIWCDNSNSHFTSKICCQMHFNRIYGTKARLNGLNGKKRRTKEHTIWSNECICAVAVRPHSYMNDCNESTIYSNIHFWLATHSTHIFQLNYNTPDIRSTSSFIRMSRVETQSMLICVPHIKSDKCFASLIILS